MVYFLQFFQMRSSDSINLAVVPNTTVEVGTELTATVTNVGVTKMYAITFANKCSRTTEYDHTAASNQLKTLDNDFVTLMEENNGIYKYKYTVKRRGDISIFIDQYLQESLFYYYNQQNHNGVTVLEEKNNTDLSFDWGDNDVFNARTDELSFYIYFYILPPQSDTYMFRMITHNPNEAVLEFRDSGISLSKKSIYF